MKKIRIGQLGAMHDHAGDIIQTLKKMSNIYEIVGVAIPEEEIMLNPQLYDGIPQMCVGELLECKNLQAITVETSEVNLSKYAKLAAERKLAVHMDKPGGIVLADFEHLIETVKRNNTVLHTGYMYRYNPAVMQLKKDIDRGKLGCIYSVEAHMNCFHNATKRQWLSQFPGGMMFFLGCHLIDMICYLQGFPIDVVPYTTPTGFDGVDADDFGFTVLRYTHGISFAKTCAAELGGFMRRQLVVCGEKGTVQLLPFEAPPDITKRTDLYTGVRECFDLDGGWFYDGTSYRTKLYDRYIPMMCAFASYVSGTQQNPFTPDYELALYRTIMRACSVIV
ncbi:MAG: Gfo/Idh/MocA family protein [Christensenellales bacterium]|jgi:predicted dehydrogenase